MISNSLDGIDNPYPNEVIQRDVYAGLLIRLIAGFIDLIILYVTGTTLILVLLTRFPGLAVSSVPGLDLGEYSHGFGSWIIRTVLIWIIYTIILVWLYSAVLESSRFQGTFGKQILNLIVCSYDGTRLSFFHATIRFFAKMLSLLSVGLGYILIAFTRKKQAIHDIVARTVVVIVDTKGCNQQPTEDEHLIKTCDDKNRGNWIAWVVLIGSILLFFFQPIILLGMIVMMPDGSSHTGTVTSGNSQYLPGPSSQPSRTTFWDPDIGSASGRYSEPWHQVVNVTPFSKRTYYSVNVFKDRLWVIGGININTPKNDVWYSDDGEHWNIATSAAPFSPRSSHAACVFNGKLWITGGYGISQDGSSNRRLNDVWWTEDGVNWTEATPNAKFSPRHLLSMTAYNGKLWVVGGTDDNVQNLNDVWYSDDGEHWNLATSDAPFKGRSSFNLIDFDGELWIIGGIDEFGHVYDTWHSSDGKTWTRGSSLAFGSSNNQGVALINGALWAIQDELQTNGIILRGIWSSPDGTTWNAMSDPPEYHQPFHYIEGIGLDEYHLVSFRDSLWIFRQHPDIIKSTKNDIWSCPISMLENQSPQTRFMPSTMYGFSPLTITFHDLSLNRPSHWQWDFGDDTGSDEQNPVHTFEKPGNYTVILKSSSVHGNQTASQSILIDKPVRDGVNWTLASCDPPYGSRMDFQITDNNGKIWLVGGQDPTGKFNDVWSSSDGITWSELTAHAAFSPRSSASLLTYNGKLWVIGGAGRNENSTSSKAEICYNDVYNSDDGVTWNLVTAHAGFSPRCDQAAVVYDNKMWIIGGKMIRDESNSPIYYNDVWSSSDGANWSPVTRSATVTPREGTCTFVFDDAIWLLGTRNPEELWRSTNGKDWISVSDAQKSSLLSGPGPVVIVYNDTIRIFQDATWGSTSHSANPILSSKDGTHWLRYSAEISPVLSKGSYLYRGLFHNGQMWLFGHNEIWHSEG